MSFHLSMSGDDLYRRVIEDEIDGSTLNVHPDMRQQFVQQVLDMMEGEIVEGLASASLRPELLTIRLREAVAHVLHNAA